MNEREKKSKPIRSFIIRFFNTKKYSIAANFSAPNNPSSSQNMLKCHWLRYLSKQKKRNQIGIAGGILHWYYDSNVKCCCVRFWHLLHKENIFQFFVPTITFFFLVVVLGICWHFPSLYLLSRRIGDAISMATCVARILY